MEKKEFEAGYGKVVLKEVYNEVEKLYMNSSKNKDDFCMEAKREKIAEKILENLYLEQQEKLREIARLAVLRYAIAKSEQKIENAVLVAYVYEMETADKELYELISNLKREQYVDIVEMCGGFFWRENLVQYLEMKISNIERS
ncbi:MAG: hypothetical protein LBQ27_00485 [Clostridiales bacterium]|jgi:hypothetical protein|nr:hypothetical protein [Clostridiales bacterium]